MAKIISPAELVGLIPDGATLMVGGFMGCGTAHNTIDALSRSGKGNFTVICNDGAMPGGCLGEENYGVAKLIHNKQVKKFYVSHIGMNSEAGKQMKNGEMDVVLIPQGSLVEMIRAGGSGLGGIITPTGVGTLVEDMEHVLGKISLQGRDYLIEMPLHADWALLSCYEADRLGNAWYKGTTRNMNTLMAMAADNVVMEAENIVEIGQILPENVMTPSIFVDYLLAGGDK